MATDRAEWFLVVVNTMRPWTSETDSRAVTRLRSRSRSLTRRAAHSPTLRPVNAANRTCSPLASSIVSARAAIVSADSNRARDDSRTSDDLTSSTGFFTRANLKWAGIKGADLSGAIMTGARFTGASANDGTTWPVGFDLVRAGVIFED